ncbi:DNA replication factor C complex subunit 4 [Dunaliella salina]|uniref:DNA replication factor C complex subunit 4 n=1 Tax=Dunaliella salina TaxID=3046 RepID=A0ABQ7G940_DUNSA|nr:DNA replication factor C complex subunit 4 [Dunaliella salina]|eukprot:KAF5831087.1 DNA replication factor C complex subunit 4 [Dunaliella salina]
MQMEKADKPASSQPWTEKYRPRTVSDVAHQTQVVDTLTKALETANLPHLLFYGPPGTGKTTTALAIARQLYGHSSASVQVIDGFPAVHTFYAPRYPCPPYKLLILDEADSMTQDAQNALRRTMETYSKVTRFCFICNYVSRIIEPLASRCAKFRFKPLHETVMGERINFICEQEHVQLSEESLATLGAVSGGDLRRAITTLQSAVRLGGPVVKRQTILDVAGQIPPEHIQQLLQACKSRSFQELQKQVDGAICNGYAAQQVMLQLQGLLLEDAEASDIQKAGALEAMAVADKDLVDGADEHLQLLHVTSLLQKHLSSSGARAA